MLMLVLNLVASQMDKSRELKLPVSGAEHAPALIAFLERQQVKIEQAPPDAERQVRAGDLDVLVEIDPAFGADVAKGKPEPGNDRDR